MFTKRVRILTTTVTTGLLSILTSSASLAIELSDSSHFTAEVFCATEPSREVRSIVVTPGGAPSYPYYIYTTDWTYQSLSSNLNGIDAAGNASILHTGFADLMFLQFASPAFGSSLYGADVGYPSSLPDGIYHVSPEGNLASFNLMGGGNPDPSEIVFPGGGPFGDYLYVSNPGAGGTQYASGIIRLDQAGAYAGRLAAIPEGPRRMALSGGGDFGTYLYYSCSSSPWIYRAAADGSVQQFALLPYSDWAYGMAFGCGENFGDDLYVCSWQDDEILRIDSSGTVTTFARGITSFAMAFDPVSKDLFVADRYGKTILRIRSDSTSGIAGGHGDPLRGTNRVLVATNPTSGSSVSATVRIAVPGLVRMDLVSVAGRTVAPLFCGQLEVGIQHLTCSLDRTAPSELRSGVYFLRAHGPSLDATCRIVLVR
jgi:hypothetical protein